MNALTKVHKVVAVLHYPVHMAVEKMHGAKHRHRITRKRLTKVGVGICITVVGATMASHPVTFIPAVLWEAVSWTLHGYGAVPVVKLFCEIVDLESLEED